MIMIHTPPFTNCFFYKVPDRHIHIAKAEIRHTNEIFIFKKASEVAK